MCVGFRKKKFPKAMAQKVEIKCEINFFSPLFPARPPPPPQCPDSRILPQRTTSVADTIYRTNYTVDQPSRSIMTTFLTNTPHYLPLVGSRQKPRGAEPSA